MKVTKELIENCSHHYYNMELMPDVVYKERSSTCHSHNAVYNLMHYILDSSFMPSKVCHAYKYVVGHSFYSLNTSLTN